MKKEISILALVLLFVGSSHSIWASEPRSDASNERSTPALWIRACVSELAKTREKEVRHFNNISANDVVFLPKRNAAQEIFMKCKNVRPISASQASDYIKWLKDRISSIQNITVGRTTRKQVNGILLKNGGLSTPLVQIYNDMESNHLKVRIEFDMAPGLQGKLISNESDKVKDMSMPYLGFIIMD